MNHLFIIEAHNQLPLLKNLVEMLDAPNHHFLIHLDKKSKALMNDQIVKQISCKSNAQVMCYKSVYWG